MTLVYEGMIGVILKSEVSCYYIHIAVLTKLFCKPVKLFVLPCLQGFFHCHNDWLFHPFFLMVMRDPYEGPLDKNKNLDILM